MKTITIDFTKTPVEISDNVLGNQGEHNATELLITPPSEMSNNAKVTRYSVAFQIGAYQVYHSKEYEKAATITVPIEKEVSRTNVIYLQLEGYDDNDELVIKSDRVGNFIFKPSVCGEEMSYSDEPNSIGAAVQANTNFRKKLEDNAETLDKLSTSQSGKLLFNGKIIEGSSNGSASLDIEVVSDTEDEYVLKITTDSGTIITPNLKGKEGASGVYVGSGEMPEGYNIQIDPTGEATVIPTKTSELINDSGYLTAKDLLEIEPNSIPDYWNEHLENKIKTIKSNQEKGGKDSFSFIIITDIHYDQNLGKRSPLLAKKIMEECNVKYALILGDLVTRSVVNTEAEMEKNFTGVKEMLQPISGKALLTQGNHDGAWGTLNSVSYCYNYPPEKIYERIYRPVGLIDGVHFDESGTGYYIDDTANKVRYIMLNTHCVEYEKNDDGTAKNNTMHKFGCSESQFDMLISALNGLDSDNWSVVVGSHIPVMHNFDYNGDGNSDYFLHGTDIHFIRKLIVSFNNRTKYTATEEEKSGHGISDSIWSYVNTEVDFTNAKGRVLGCFAGHTHCDFNLPESVAGVPVITTRCDSKNESQNSSLVHLYNERKNGTITEQSFDVVTVDKKNRVAYITKIGAGNSREISLDDTAVYSITSSLPNASIDNDLKAIRENSSYSATVSAKAGYELSNVTVTMGGADITALAYSDGTVSIEKVTGNIDIVVTTTAITSVSYTNLIPLSVNSDDTPYIGENGEDGYKTNARISSSSGNEVENYDGMCCTGFIPCLSGQTIRIANVSMIGSTGVSYIIIYDGNKNFINAVSTNDMTENNGVYSYSPSQGSMAFIRLSIGEITDESIVTIDEEIGA